MLRTICCALLAVSMLWLGCDKADEPDTVDYVAPDTTEGQAAVEKGESTAQNAAEELNRPKENGTLHDATDAQIKQLEAAKALFFDGDLAGAEEAFKVLIATGPLSPEKVSAYVALGQIYRETDRQDKAVELFEKLTTLAPAIPEGHFMLGRAYADQSESTRAIKSYERTIQMQPDYLRAYVELGGLYNLAGRSEDAQNILFKYEKKVYGLAGKLESADTPTEDKLHILDVFGFVDDDRVSSAIMKSILDPDPRVRETAIYLARDYRLGDARPALKVLAENDPSQRVRFAAGEVYDALEGAPTGTAAPVELDKAPE